MKDDSLRETTKMSHLSVGITSFNPRLNADDSLAGNPNRSLIYPLANEIEWLLSPQRNLYGFYPLAKEIEWLLSLQMKSDGVYPRSGDNPNLAVG